MGDRGLEQRQHLSIGEVLAMLQSEFPDVSISKIRFLESQGLVDPERTPSGYRKFYDADIERLRWILRQQREKFLPLKVIKDLLASGDVPPPAEVPLPTPEERARGAAESQVVPEPQAPGSYSLGRPHTQAPAPALDTGLTGASLTLDELATAANVAPETLAELERFGLIVAKQVGNNVYYDEEALIVARVAGRFNQFGVEPRHLRMYRTSAEREAGFFEQVVVPLLKQRNPAARRQAVESLDELTQLGADLRAAMMRRSLRRYVE